MTKVVFNAPRFPVIDREDFLTPFDKMFDQIVATQKTTGISYEPKN